MRPLKLRQFKLEEKLFIYILLFIIFVSATSITINILVDYPFGVNYKWIGSITISLVALYFASKKMYMKQFQVVIFICIIYFLLPMGWISAGGPNNFSIAYFFLICITVNYLFTGRTRVIFIFSLIAIFCFLVLLHNQLPSFFPVYSKQQNLYDMIVQVPLTLLMASFLLRQFASAYRQERNKLKSYSDLLNEQNKLLEKLTFTDELTQLFNRRYLFQKLEEYKQEERKIIVLILDIDNFKQINDRYGHETGDKALIRFANLLKEELADTRTVGRYGGDEFLVLIDEMDAAQCRELIDHLLEKVHKMQFNEKIKLSASGGMAFFDGKTSIREVLANADQLLYQVKVSGKNNILFDEKPDL
ncbi:GGDEF domain-containing protein [Sediminibacillus albus]|uniref:Diguanylate cyclase (GGDEF) domain-containing protein n=1 Tax=Sediminibacillus albus TaxID=407036 RepID=A0A1G8X0L7_9BACI|nr:GGDEF domain-containing protein [Sediminibacillus albus]SDJ83877.1 diguanylate cyclase (GGDEF) domain-containing protein [Sediminibacillus albus]